MTTLSPLDAATIFLTMTAGTFTGVLAALWVASRAIAWWDRRQ